MRMFNPSYVAKFNSFFATVKDLLIGMKLGRCLVILIVLMGLLIAFGNRGLVDSFMMKEKLASLKKSNQHMTIENYDLKMNILLLRSNQPYIEVVARNELGMVRVGDLVYRCAQ
ncbi:MAG: septum formation initiator family protein [Deltaproteobacteria bacterium]